MENGEPFATKISEKQKLKWPVFKWVSKEEIFWAIKSNQEESMCVKITWVKIIVEKIPNLLLQK